MPARGNNEAGSSSRTPRPEEAAEGEWPGEPGPGESDSAPSSEFGQDSSQQPQAEPESTHRNEKHSQDAEHDQKENPDDPEQIPKPDISECSIETREQLE